MRIEITFHGLADIIRSVLNEASEHFAEQETRSHRSATIDDPRCGTSFDASETIEQPAIDDSFNPAELEKETEPVTVEPVAPVKAEPATIDEVRKMLTEFMNTKGRDKTVELLKSHGLQSLTQASDKPDTLSQIAAAIRGAM